MSCGGIGIVLRPPAPIQSLFHRNLEEDRKSPAADSGRAFSVPNDYLGMSCGGIGIVLRPPAPIQSLFHRNLEEDEKSPAADSGRAFVP